MPRVSLVVPVLVVKNTGARVMRTFFLFEGRAEKQWHETNIKMKLDAQVFFPGEMLSP